MIDSPPLPIMADAIPLAKLVDGVIVVGRVNKTTREEAQALQPQLESLDAPVLGVVANRTSRGRGYSGYSLTASRVSSPAMTRARTSVGTSSRPDARYDENLSGMLRCAGTVVGRMGKHRQIPKCLPLRVTAKCARMLHRAGGVRSVAGLRRRDSS